MEKNLSKSTQLKLAFTGPESSGKTSLSKKIAYQLQANWHAEYAREYLIQRDGIYDYEDIEQIAIEQEVYRKANSQEGIQVYDTEGLVLYIWSVFKYQKCSPTVENILKSQEYDHYFLCSPDGIAWEDDPLREHPNQREELFDLYLSKIQELQYPYTVLDGSFEERINKALSAVEKLQGQG